MKQLENTPKQKIGLNKPSPPFVSINTCCDASACVHEASCKSRVGYILQMNRGFKLKSKQR